MIPLALRSQKHLPRHVSRPGALLDSARVAAALTGTQLARWGRQSRHFAEAKDKSSQGASKKEAKSTGLLDDLELGPSPEAMPSEEHQGSALTRPIEPIADQDDGERGSAKRPAYISSTDIRRDRIARYMFLGFLASTFGGAIFLGRNWEDQASERDHPDAPNGWSPSAYASRLKARYQDIVDYYNEPAFEKLLPDPLPEPYHRPYTLVLDLDDLLIHSSWDREHGWRTAKRPGLDYFLAYISQYYEVVIFTTQLAGTAAPIMQKLDPFHSHISASLFREGTRYKRGKYIKDLNFMNRPLEKIVMIDTNPDAYSLQPHNAIPMKPWHGDTSDKELVALIPFLEYVAAMGFDDVRPVLRDYEGKNIAQEYARRESIAREDFKRRVAVEEKGRRSTSWALQLLGLAPANQPAPQLLQDQQRERGQQGYMEYKKYLEEHGAQMVEEEKKKEEEMFKGMKTSLSKIMTEGIPKPPGQ